MTEICSHHIIEDWIDIDPDQSKQIFYCTHCFTCFCHKEYVQWCTTHLIPPTPQSH